MYSKIHTLANCLNPYSIIPAQPHICQTQILFVWTLCPPTRLHVSKTGRGLVCPPQMGEDGHMYQAGITESPCHKRIASCVAPAPLFFPVPPKISPKFVLLLSPNRNGRPCAWFDHLMLQSPFSHTKLYSSSCRLHTTANLQVPVVLPYYHCKTSLLCSLVAPYTAVAFL